MSKTLIFTEKPDVALKIASNGIKIFGEFKIDGKVVTPSYVSSNSDALKKRAKAIGWLENDRYIISFAEGHLLQLYQASDYNSDYKYWSNIPSGYVPEEFKFKPAESRKNLLDNLVKLMNRSDIDKIINAGDGDREGESIFRLIYNYAKCKKPVERLWLSSQTEDALTKAFAKPLKSGKEYDSLWNAGKSRIEADFILGALLTAKTSCVIPSEKGKFKSVGRVQTPVLAEIVRVELLNRNFKTQKFNIVKAEFETANGEKYTGEHETKFETSTEADNFIKSIENKQAIVSLYEETNSKVYSPSLYTQTTLAIDMGSQFSMKPDKVLEIAQFLYENGYTTYPRTESQHISTGDFDDFEKAYKLLANKYNLFGGDPKANYKRIVNDADVESHPAITATACLPDIAKLTEDQRNVYMAIVKRMFAVAYPPAVDRKQKIETDIGDFSFVSTATSEIQRGWRAVYQTDIKTDALPVLSENEKVKTINLYKEERETKPQPRHTLSSIMQFMETCGKKVENEEFRNILKNKGIGTGATRAQIIKILEMRYVEVKGKTIYPNEDAIDLINRFPVEQLKSAEFTGEMEYKLSLVEKGTLSREEYMDEIIKLYTNACSVLDNMKSSVPRTYSSDKTDSSSIGNCPFCGKPMRKVSGKFGDFYSCSGYKDGCKFTITAIGGKLISEAQAKKLLKNGRTDVIKGMKKKDGSVMDGAYLSLNKEDKKIDLKFERK